MMNKVKMTLNVQELVSEFEQLESFVQESIKDTVAQVNKSYHPYGCEITIKNQNGDIIYYQKGGRP